MFVSSSLVLMHRVLAVALIPRLRNLFDDIDKAYHQVEMETIPSHYCTISIITQTVDSRFASHLKRYGPNFLPRMK